MSKDSVSHSGPAVKESAATREPTKDHAQKAADKDAAKMESLSASQKRQAEEADKKASALEVKTAAAKKTAEDLKKRPEGSGSAPVQFDVAAAKECVDELRKYGDGQEHRPCIVRCLQSSINNFLEQNVYCLEGCDVPAGPATPVPMTAAAVASGVDPEASKSAHELKLALESFSTAHQNVVQSAQPRLRGLPGMQSSISDTLDDVISKQVALLNSLLSFPRAKPVPAE